MANASDFQSTIRVARKKLRRMLDATPARTRRYGELDDEYEKLHELEQEELSGTIAAADKNYAAFTEATEELIAELGKEQAAIQRVAKVIDRVAKVLEVAGKVAKKLRP